MRKRSHPLLICRRVKKLRLLRPLVVSARHSFPSTRLLPPLHITIRPSPCHDTYLPAPTHSPPRTIIRTPKASNFLCCPLHPLTSSPAILLLHSFDALIRPSLKAVYLSTASFGDAGEEANFIFLFYRAESHRVRLGYPFLKMQGRRRRSFLLPLSFIPVIILHLRANSPSALAGGDI